jgi:hypothetical protein
LSEQHSRAQLVDAVAGGLSILPKRVLWKDQARMKLWAWDKKNLPSIGQAIRTAVAGTSASEVIAKHWQAALRGFTSGFVLDDIPVFGQTIVLDPDNIRGDPGNWRAMS